MNEKTQLVVTIGPDGRVRAETKGVIGPACLNYIPLLEELLDAEAVSSEFTADYTRTTMQATSEELAQQVAMEDDRGGLGS